MASRGSSRSSVSGENIVEDADLTVDVRRLHAEEVSLNLANILDVRIRGVEAEISVDAGLDRLLAFLERALKSLGENPEARRALLRTVDQTLGTVEDVAKAADKSDVSRGSEITEAAQRKAGELDVNLAGVRGTGSGGRVLVKDVEGAARG